MCSNSLTFPLKLPFMCGVSSEMIDIRLVKNHLRHSLTLKNMFCLTYRPHEVCVVALCLSMRKLRAEPSMQQ